jgi:3-methyladenine DNA glycosylase AlkC
MAAFKDAIDAAAIARISQQIHHVYPDFPAERFQSAADGVAPLELKDRVRHVARALRASLPDDWTEAVRILVRSLPPATPPEEGLSAGFWVWPILQVVEDHAADPSVSLPALREMTSRFSAEFAIRPLIDAYPDETWPVLESWVTDPDPHVRRLVSEGTRPRLPWGRRLSASVRDPSRVSRWCPG